MFESESDRKCENKYNIDNIRPYPIHLHSYNKVYMALTIDMPSLISLSFKVYFSIFYYCCLKSIYCCLKSICMGQIGYSDLAISLWTFQSRHSTGTRIYGSAPQNFHTPNFINKRSRIKTKVQHAFPGSNRSQHRDPQPFPCFADEIWFMARQSSTIAFRSTLAFCTKVAFTRQTGSWRVPISSGAIGIVDHTAKPQALC